MALGEVLLLLLQRSVGTGGGRGREERLSAGVGAGSSVGTPGSRPSKGESAGKGAEERPGPSIPGQPDPPGAAGAP